MSWFPDMGTVTMIDAGDHVRAVGWLSAKHPYTPGEVPAEFLTRLREFAKRWGDSTEAIGWGIFMGPHCCELCGRFMAGGNFGVPWGGLLFAAPDMLPHYVEAHGYRPPDEFITAVMESPLPGSAEYTAAVEPFRRLHEQYQERQHQARIEYAGRWAFEQGGSTDSISEAGFRFFCDRSPEMCEHIRLAMPSAEPSATADPARDSASGSS